jgi:hypothetical protein
VSNILPLGRNRSFMKIARVGDAGGRLDRISLNGKKA